MPLAPPRPQPRPPGARGGKMRRNSDRSERSASSGSDDSDEDGFDSDDEKFEEPDVPIFDAKADIFHRDEGGMLSADGQEIYFTGALSLPLACLLACSANLFARGAATLTLAHAAP